MRIFVTGTDTDIGKTFVSAWLCRHFGLDYFKPIQAGLYPGTDSDWVKAHAACRIHPESYRLREPASPHYAAEREGQVLSLDRIQLPDTSRLLVEGAGGVMVPLGAGKMMIDLMAALALPVLVVASTRLGTLNHTLLTITALRARNIPLTGVILNGEPSEMVARTLTEYGDVPVLQQIPQMQVVSPEALATLAPSQALRCALEAL